MHPRRGVRREASGAVVAMDYNEWMLAPPPEPDPIPADACCRDCRDYDGCPGKCGHGWCHLVCEFVDGDDAPCDEWVTRR